VLRRRKTVFAALLWLAAIASAAELTVGEYRGTGVTVRIDQIGQEIRGSILRGDRVFPFTATQQANGLIEGKFLVGQDSFAFTLQPGQEGQFTFETGGKRLSLTPPAPAQLVPPPGPQGGAHDPAATAERIRIYDPRTIRDEKSSLDVATILVPQGWQMDHGVLWRIERSNFVTLETTISDPRTGWTLRWIPRDQFNCCPAWYANAVQQNQGLLTVGGMELCDRVWPPADFILQAVLPRYRRVPGAQVVRSDDLPEVAARITRESADEIALMRQNGQEARYGAGRVRIEYPGARGGTIHEDIYGIVQLTWSPQGNANAQSIGQPALESYMISPMYLYSFAAPKGELERATPVLQTVFSSMTITPSWYAFHLNLAQMFRQAAAHDLRMIAEARKQITESQRKSWGEMIQQMQRHSNAVGELLSGTSSYINPQNPSGPPMTVPTGQTPWMNPQGQMATTPSPNIKPHEQAAGQNPNPNAPPPNTNQNWTPMDPVQPK